MIYIIPIIVHLFIFAAEPNSSTDSTTTFTKPTVEVLPSTEFSKGHFSLTDYDVIMMSLFLKNMSHVIDVFYHFPLFREYQPVLVRKKEQ